MSAMPSSPTRRSILAASAPAGAIGLLPATPRATAEDDAIRPFHINVPQEALVDLRRRLAATPWPDRETVTDQSQGVQLATIYFNEVNKGGHFAAWEQPELFSAELRAAFRSLRQSPG
jgi:pimeloyl-ACP methyl ester carboxylesterase